MNEQFPIVVLLVLQMKSNQIQVWFLGFPFNIVRLGTVTVRITVSWLRTPSGVLTSIDVITKVDTIRFFLLAVVVRHRRQW